MPTYFMRWKVDPINDYTKLLQVTIGTRERVRAETDTRLAPNCRYPYHVPLTILNIATRLHQYSMIIFTVGSQYVGGVYTFLALYTIFQKISPRHVGDSPRDCGFPSFTPSSMVGLGLLDVVSYIVLGSSATLALFLLLTTWYYRRSESEVLSEYFIIVAISFVYGGRI